MGNQSLGNYTTIQKLGKGIYGKTRLSQSPDNYLLAIKIYEVIDRNHLNPVIKRTLTHLNFQSKFTVKVKDVFAIDDTRFGAVMKYYPQGNLAANLKFKTVKQTLLSMKQLALCVRFLHLQKKMAHKNIKPENILVNDHTLLLSDISCALGGHLRLRSTPGGYDYSSRQSFEESASFSSDIWSLGLVFIEMVLGKRMRQLQSLQGVERPSLLRQEYPSTSVLNSIFDEDIRYLIRKMVEPSPVERMTIVQVVELISNLLSTVKSPQVLATPVRKLEERQQVENIPQFIFTFDRNHPCYDKFRIIQDTVCRVDSQPKRYQVVARQSIPTGKWKVTFRILDYGTDNEAIVIGILAEERRKQLMSGDVDQYHSVALWSNRSNKQSNICENGVWNSEPLPYLRETKGLLQVVIDTIGREIQWWVDGRCVAESSLAEGFWNQEYYLFLGLRGQNCKVKVGEQKEIK